jgi:toxin ParE1/3/4
MTDYRKTELAERDIEEIALYGIQRHGIVQAQQYQKGLEARFNAIATNPLHYQAVDHIKPGYRHCVYGSHTIYFRIEPETVLIVRILRSQDIARALQERT